MLFVDLPFVERVERIHELGFLVEIWDWTAKDIDALVATGAAFSSMTGYIEGDLTDRDGHRAAAGDRRAVDPGRAPARLPAAQPARHRARREGLPVAPGRGA